MGSVLTVMMPVYSAVSYHNNIIIIVYTKNYVIYCCIIACRTGNLRLQRSTAQGSGRVEICINNVWGTICDNSWSSNDARVVCKQLGFSIVDKGYKTTDYIIILYLL